MALLYIKEQASLESWADKVTPTILLTAGLLIVVFGDAVKLIAGVGAIGYGLYLFLKNHD
jgi:small-conductance mechanosensitive channel